MKLSTMTRKPTTFKNIKTINVDKVEFDLGDLDVYTPSDLNLNSCFRDDISTEFDVPQEFILLANRKEYYVDTQGYDYIRYIAQLVN